MCKSVKYHLESTCSVNALVKWSSSRLMKLDKILGWFIVETMYKSLWFRISLLTLLTLWNVFPWISCIWLFVRSITSNCVLFSQMPNKFHGNLENLFPVTIRTSVSLGMYSRTLESVKPVLVQLVMYTFLSGFHAL